MARTEARLDATGAVTRRRSAGPWEPAEPRTDWARVDATTDAEIERQAAFDDAEAAKDAAAWVRRVRRRAGLSQAAAGCGPRSFARDRPSAGSRARAECELNHPHPGASTSNRAGGVSRGACGYPGARVVPRHAHGRTLGRVGHQSAHDAAVRSGSEGGRHPRRVSRRIVVKT